MGNFEWALTTALNSFFKRDGIQAIAYRLKQSRFASQLVDILVDSRIPEYYLAIECKSLDARKTKTLYFKQHFSFAAGDHQLARETKFIIKSGRQGILAVELRHGAGTARTAHLVPWGEVYQNFQAGKVGLTLEEIQQSPALERKGGTYAISHLDIVRISGYYDLKIEDADWELSDSETDSESDGSD
jgi:hypothetical protein